MPRTEPSATLDIDLDAVARNWLSLRKRLKAGADCAAVVKADAYGLGAAPVAAALFAQGCRHFFVATSGEAFALRESLPQKDALVYALHGPDGAAPADFAAQNVIPVLNTPGDIALWRRNAAGAPCALHVDTGMNRLGLSEKEFSACDPAGLNLRLVMSHLACADDPGHPMNRRQRDLFDRLSPGPWPRSLANSGGILLGPDYHFDLVRPGAFLYGINPQPGQAPPPQNVVTLKARILQVRVIDSPATVGYGATCAVGPQAVCATIAAGYADGYLRSLTGRGAVHISGERCPVLGRVSMDSVVVDVTALKTPPRPGDMAEIIGPDQSADDVAAQAETIGYEILTAMGQRYARRYSGAGGKE